MKNLNQYSKQFLLLALMFTLIFQSCTKEEEQDNPNLPETHERGEISKSSSLGTLTPDDIQQILDATSIQIPFTLNYAVDVLSVDYYTIDGDGNETIASGAFLIPQGTDNLTLLSIQHGTETKTDLVASVSPNNSVEGIIGLITASLGYIAVIPDYLGFGTSDIMHPYLHAESIVPSVIDFMRACKSYSSENQISLDGRVFLTGYSEGGFVTLVTQKAIEEQYSNEFDLSAVAPLAGPYDLKGMTDTIFHADS